MKDHGMPKDEERQERETTTAERILAIALAIFLLVGGLRIVGSIDRAFTSPDFTAIRQQFITEEMQAQVFALTSRKYELMHERDRLQRLEFDLFPPYEKAREEYRTLLDRGIDDPEKRVAWQRARDAYEQAKAHAAAANAAFGAFFRDVFEPQTKEYRDQEARASEEFGRQMSARNRRAGFALLAYALLGFAASLWVYNYFRIQPKLSRYALIGLSILGFGAVQALVVTFRIVYPYLLGVVPVEAIISIGGSAISITGIVYLKNKFFSRTAIQNRRLWRGVCPACGFPNPGEFCAWCGANQHVECPHCQKRTAQALPHCQACGKTR